MAFWKKSISYKNKKNKMVKQIMYCISIKIMKKLQRSMIVRIMKNSNKLLGLDKFKMDTLLIIRNIKIRIITNLQIIMRIVKIKSHQLTQKDSPNILLLISHWVNMVTALKSKIKILSGSARLMSLVITIKCLPSIQFHFKAKQR